MGHDHSHTHRHDHQNSSNLRLAFLLNLGFTLLEIAGGFFTNSMAILSDALHDLGDSLSLGIAWYLQNKSRQKANEHFTFGYQRFSLLGALINGMVLIAGSVLIIREAAERLLHPQQAHAPGMMVLAVIGIAVNGFAAWKAGQGKSLNERVVSWHLIEDVLGWVAVLIASAVLLFKDIPYIDPALSLVITLYVLWNVFKRLKETLNVFLQGRSDDIDLEEVKRALLGIAHVDSLHHVHLWTLDGEHQVFSTHMVLKDIDSYQQIAGVKRDVNKELQPYNFWDITVEIELDESTCSLSAT